MQTSTQTNETLPEMWVAPELDTEVNPAELQDLIVAVSRGRRFVQCVRTLVATAVTTAAVALGQDWSQEGQYLLEREEAVGGPLTINR